MSPEGEGVTREGLRNALTDSFVRSARILQIALVTGIVLLAGITLALPFVLDGGGATVARDEDHDTVGASHLDEPPRALKDESGVPPGDAKPDPVLLMSIIHGALFLLAAGLAQFLYHRPGALEGRARAMDRHGLTDSSDPNRRAADALRALKIVRMALLEGVALFGLVICILAQVLVTPPAPPLVWWNGISALYVVAFGLATLPDRESMLEELVERTR